MRSLIYLMVGFQILFGSCSLFTQNKDEQVKERIDLEQVYKRGKIIAVTDYNTADYSIYMGTPMGYQYELLADFADHIGLQLEIKVESDPDIRFEMLNNNECDIIAANIGVTQERKQNAVLTAPHSQTNQILIQRKNSKADIDYYIDDVTDLALKTVYVQKNSAYALRLKNLANEIGDTIYVKEVSETVENLIKWVSSGKIDYTVCYGNIALINQNVYNNLDISLPVSLDQNLAWVVRKESVNLLNFINEWLDDYKTTTKYQVLFKRYFVTGNIGKIAQSDYFTIHTGKMSAYDHAIKKYSNEIGWDWKLLASLIYQESRFKPDVKSWAGAYGLMQLMPSTAKQYGVDTTSGPNENIRAGVRYLEWLDKCYKNDIPDNDERIKFVLASYNIGYGHIQDARNLAKKNGRNENVWDDNVEYFLLQKSKPEYYNDEVVKYGFCKGTETYKYVKEILERYRHYTNLIVEN